MRYCWFILLLATSNLDARTMGLSLDVLSAPLGSYGLRYHVHINDYLNLVVPVDVSSTAIGAIPTDTIQLFKAFGYGLTPYIKATIGVAAQVHTQGWYVEPYVKAGYAQIKYPPPDLLQSKFLCSLGFVVGHQTEFPNHLVLNLGIGFERRFFFPYEKGTDAWTPNIVGAVGYVF